jgi:hypothetical protein
LKLPRLRSSCLNRQLSRRAGARGSFVNTDPLRQLLLVLVNRIEEVTTEYSQAFALQHFSATNF